MKRILVAIDLMETTDSVINYAKLFAKKLKSELLIIHSEAIESYIASITIGLNQQPSNSLINEQKMIFEDRLKKIHLNLEKEGVKANCLLLDGPTVENILKEAKKFKSDLIVIGSHKHGKFHHLLLGSIHESLISHSPIPIMIIPPLKEK